jgi:hypothetical protein
MRAWGFILALAAGAAGAQSVEDLQRQLEERDARIRALSERVQALEKKDGGPEDEELARALERLLVQQGATLLPRRAYELEPSLTYAHWDRSRGPLRHDAAAGLALRAGLAWESQFQVRVSYAHVASDAGSVTDFGDTDFSFAKQLVREDKSRPALFGVLGWISPTGRDAFGGGVPTGGGFNVPYAALNAVKKHDPLVFYGGVSYAVPRPRTLEGERVVPGNSFGLRLGTALAASPDASVNVGLNLAVIDETRRNGQPVAGSDTVIGTLQVGSGVVLSRAVLLNVSGDFRVAGSAPNFRLTVSVPIRF